MPRTKEEIERAFENAPPNWNFKTFAGCCEYLRFLKDEALDDIPDEVLHSYDDIYFRKVRKTWWRGLLWFLEMMKEKDLIPNELIDKVNSFVVKYQAKWFLTAEHLTTKEHLDEANELIAQIVRS